MSSQNAVVDLSKASESHESKVNLPLLKDKLQSLGENVRLKRFPLSSEKFFDSGQFSTRNVAISN